MRIHLTSLTNAKQNENVETSQPTPSFLKIKNSLNCQPFRFVLPFPIYPPSLPKKTMLPVPLHRYVDPRYVPMQVLRYFAQWIQRFQWLTMASRCPEFLVHALRQAWRQMKINGGLEAMFDWKTHDSWKMLDFFEETRSRSRKTLRNLLWFVFVVARLTCGICKWFPIIQYVKAEYLHNWMSRLSPKRCHVACWTPVFDSQVIASQTPRLLPYPLPLEKTWTGKTGFCLKTLSGCHSSTRKRPNNNNNNKKKNKQKAGPGDLSHEIKDNLWTKFL